MEEYEPACMGWPAVPAPAVPPPLSDSVTSALPKTYTKIAIKRLFVYRSSTSQTDNANVNTALEVDKIEFDVTLVNNRL